MHAATPSGQQSAETHSTSTSQPLAISSYGSQNGSSDNSFLSLKADMLTLSAQKLKDHRIRQCGDRTAGQKCLAGCTSCVPTRQADTIAAFHISPVCLHGVQQDICQASLCTNPPSMGRGPPLLRSAGLTECSQALLTHPQPSTDQSRFWVPAHRAAGV